MAFYQTKPILVKAWKWFPGTIIPNVRELTEGQREIYWSDGRTNVVKAVLETPHGNYALRHGDYVVEDDEGFMAVWSPSEFIKTFSFVSDD